MNVLICNASNATLHDANGEQLFTVNSLTMLNATGSDPKMIVISEVTMSGYHNKQKIVVFTDERVNEFFYLGDLAELGIDAEPFFTCPRVTNAPEFTQETVDKVLISVI